MKEGEIRNSILVEHGFSALATILADEVSHCLLFDFGFSEHGAAFNVTALNVDLLGVETMALSHGHIDYLEDLKQLVERVGREGCMHLTAFRHPRYIKFTEQLKINPPVFTHKKSRTWESR